MSVEPCQKKKKKKNNNNNNNNKNNFQQYLAPQLPWSTHKGNSNKTWVC